jgi:ABC-type glycerol-3-phosphate transport system substrate-binding protein
MQLLRAIHKKMGLILFVTLISTSLFGCGGGSSGPTPTSHTVNIFWAANREAAVNSAGGGYTVAISGQSPINVPYVSGPAAPTTIAATLMSGSYSVAVTAYSALNPPGGSTGSTSVPSAAFNFSVPY